MKIEFDLPNFEKELSINIIIRKDGEVVCTASSPSGSTMMGKEIAAKTTAEKVIVEGENKAAADINTQKNITAENPAAKRIIGGNMMQMEF